MEEWLNILNWKTCPIFGNVHIIEDYASFMENYYLSREIERFKRNMLTTLTGGFEQHNIRIMGRRGCGKTSFIYYLTKGANADANKVLSRRRLKISTTK